MNRQRDLTFIFAMLASAALLPMQASGMTAAANGTHAANQDSPRREMPRKPRKANSPQQLKDAQRQAMRDKEKTRRIAAYKLFRDPQFKLEGAIADRRSFDLIARSQASDAARSLPGATPPRPPAGGIPTGAFKAMQPDNAIAFNCHEKILNPSISNRETSACYQYGLDKSWKAQTYVSRQRVEGNWGGGVALGIAY